ncbi:MAG: 30S ribosomal protein S9 [Candidatus Omnitrophica bacterium]|nr:30S ribosomal protein S9 [Candidatus Omnitrophota bacterium]MBU2044717.1 30S ribosomal protein S9 [Candidatus Omnitrophota bacterium]MBU2250743.1 30S ribosomal protein S9 [Candidatus Omnitrophota bacterium]MBU2265935.1 30S ribosomal protein S9 [Candidatus Omnitrophota bacterium]MBU2473486.1 30S ribosomal protein S9 [Candidatus Omnitrophota bacterium]
MKEKPKEIFSATGRRKEAVACVRLIPQGKGKIVINGKQLNSYFATVDNQAQVKKALLVIEAIDKMDVLARVRGGGLSGQAGAVSLGISRCLVKLDPQLRSTLRREDLLTRDPRAKERKKYGRKGARRRFQWTKR